MVVGEDAALRGTAARCERCAGFRSSAPAESFGHGCASAPTTTVRRHDPRAGTRPAPRSAFDEPQRAIAPGQAAVAYDGDLVLGGGWIEA